MSSLKDFVSLFWELDAIIANLKKIVKFAWFQILSRGWMHEIYYIEFWGFSSNNSAKQRIIWPHRGQYFSFF